MIASLNRPFYNRVLLSIALSISLHALLFALPAGSLRAQSSSDKPNRLSVRLLRQPSAASHDQQKSARKLLDRASSPQREQVAPVIEHVPERGGAVSSEAANQQASSVEKKEPVAEEGQGLLQGFALPKSIGLPWMMNLQARPVQQHEMPADVFFKMREEQMAAQNRRMMVMQISAALSAALSTNEPVTSGRCSVSQTGEHEPLQISCEPLELEALLQNQYANILNSLLKMPENHAGLEISINQNQVQIKLPPAKQGVYWVSPSKGLTKP